MVRSAPKIFLKLTMLRSENLKPTINLNKLENLFPRKTPIKITY